MIVVGIGLVAYGIYVKYGSSGDKQSGASAAPAPPVFGQSFGEIRLPLPADCSIAEIRPEGDRLYLRTGPAGPCERLFLIDTAQGRIVGTISLHP